MYKILIADNQPEWLKFSRRVLQDHGYDVITAETIAALDKLLKENGHDLVLINADLMFGEFQEPIRQLILRNEDKPIIIVSVPSSIHQTVQETRTAFKLGAKDCVNKPFSSERLLALVKQLLDEFVGPQSKSQGVYA